MKCPKCNADNEIGELNRCWKCGKDLSTVAARRSEEGCAPCAGYANGERPVQKHDDWLMSFDPGLKAAYIGHLLRTEKAELERLQSKPRHSHTG